MSERTKHIAEGDAQFPERSRFFPEDPFSTDPAEWARAYIQSGDVSDVAILYWFMHAMHAARFGVYEADPSAVGD